MISFEPIDRALGPGKVIDSMLGSIKALDRIGAVGAMGKNIEATYGLGALGKAVDVGGLGALGEALNANIAGTLGALDRIGLGAMGKSIEATYGLGSLGKAVDVGGLGALGEAINVNTTAGALGALDRIGLGAMGKNIEATYGLGSLDKVINADIAGTLSALDRIGLAAMGKNIDATYGLGALGRTVDVGGLGALGKAINVNSTFGALAVLDNIGAVGAMGKNIEAIYGLGSLGKAIDSMVGSTGAIDSWLTQQSALRPVSDAGGVPQPTDSQASELLILEDDAAASFLSWIGSRSPSLEQVKYVCDWLAVAHTSMLLLMYELTGEVDAPELFAGVALAWLVILLRLLARQR